MKNKFILILIASVLFSGQLACQKQEDKQTPQELARQLFVGVKDSKTTPAIISALIKAGAEVNATNSDGMSPLMMAAWTNSNPEVLATLIKARAEVNATNSDGMSPLMWAAKTNSNPEVLATLIKAGAEVNATNSDGKKAIDYAKENDALKDTDVYWQLHDASFEE